MVKPCRECSHSLRNYRVLQETQQQEEVVLPLLTSSKLERRVRLVVQAEGKRVFVDHKRPTIEVELEPAQQLIVSLNPSLRSLLGVKRGKTMRAVFTDGWALTFTFPDGTKELVNLRYLPECTMVLV